jgi:hypothetical protein
MSVILKRFSASGVSLGYFPSASTMSDVWRNVRAFEPFANPVWPVTVLDSSRLRVRQTPHP